MKKIPLVPLALLLALAGCATHAPVLIEHRSISKPELQTIQTEDVGSSLLSFEQGSAKRSLRVVEPWGLTPNSRKEIPPQVLQPIDAGPRISTFAIDQPSADAPKLRGFKFCFDKTDNSAFIPNTFGVCDLVGKAILNSGPLKVEPADYVDPQSHYFKQELVYAGRLGNTLRFVYRQHSNDQSKPALSHEVSYDASEGTVGYKGARIEVLAATANTIKYRVLRHFER